MRSLALCLLLLGCSNREEPTANPASAEEAAPAVEAAPAEAPTQEPAAAPEPVPGATPVAQGQPCEGQTCAEGLSCVSYFGIAGPNGPKFSSCEIPCADTKDACPSGQRCVTIADGPGQVCRP